MPASTTSAFRDHSDLLQSSQRKPVQIDGVNNRAAPHESGEPNSSRDNAALQFEWVRDRAGFDALGRDWDELFERAGRSNHVFQTFAWCWHWANAYLDPNDDSNEKTELSILTARKAGKLVLVWPLVLTKTAGLKQLAWMGEPVGQYGDVLVDKSAGGKILDNAWEKIRTHPSADVIYLRRVRADSQVAPLLGEVDAHASNQVTAPYADLTEISNYETFAEMRYSRRARRNRGRLRRRLEERGEITFRKVEQGPEAKALTIKALELKRLWLIDRGLASPALNDDRTTKFFTNVAEASDHQTGFVFHGVFCDGTLIAAEIAFQCKGRNALHIIVFDLEYEKAGAGIYLLEHTFAAGIEDGLETYDLLAPGDRYKLEWCESTVDLHDWASGNTLAGKVYATVYLSFVREQVKHAWNRMPSNLRKMLKHVTGR